MKFPLGIVIGIQPKYTMTLYNTMKPYYLEKREYKVFAELNSNIKGKKGTFIF